MGIVHKNEEDYGRNYTITWGEFKGTNVVVIELEKNVEVRTSDEFLFRGKCVTHTREAIQGVKKLADIFTHNNMLDMCKREKS